MSKIPDLKQVDKEIFSSYMQSKLEKKLLNIVVSADDFNKCLIGDKKEIFRAATDFWVTRFTEHKKAKDIQDLMISKIKFKKREFVDVMIKFSNKRITFKVDKITLKYLSEAQKEGEIDNVLHFCVSLLEPLFTHNVDE